MYHSTRIGAKPTARASARSRSGRPGTAILYTPLPPAPLAPSAAYVDACARFADFDGRTSRRAFLGFWGVHVTVTLGLGAASAVAGALADLPWVWGGAVLALYLVLTFFPSLAAVARRLHDTGRTSWLCALLGLPPLTLLVVWWCLLPGQAGPNAWGQAPS